MQNESLICVSYFMTHLLEAIVLITVRTVPAVPVPIRHHCVLITEPAVHIGMDGLLSGNKMMWCNMMLSVKPKCSLAQIVLC